MAKAQTKGTNLVDMVRFLRRQREAALALLPQSLHHYLDTRLNVAAWYPEEDMIALVRVLAKLMPGAGDDPQARLAHIGRLNARLHLEGTYAHLLVDARLAQLPLRAVALWRSMHDTGDFKISLEKDHADARLGGYGHPTPEMCTMLGGYVLELFEMAGVREPTGDEVTCCRAGAPECRWRITWSA